MSTNSALSDVWQIGVELSLLDGKNLSYFCPFFSNFLGIELGLGFLYFNILKMQEMMYKKDFDGWNFQKKYLDKVDNACFYPRSRQIWYVKLGINVGCEADGKGEYTRPILVVQKIGSLFWCVPMTSKSRNNIFHYKIQSFAFRSIISFLMLSQARILDRKRFHEMLGYVSVDEFEIIKKLLRNMYLPEVPC